MTAVCDDRLLRLIEPLVERGQLSLANQLRRVLYSDAPDVFALVDFADDEVFLQPTAFAYVARQAHSPADLALAYLGAIPPDKRPLRFDAGTDGLGRLFLPGLGYLSGLPRSASVELQRDDHSPVGYVPVGISAQAIPLANWRIAPPRLTILPYPVDALAGAVEAEGGRLPGLEDAAGAHRATVAAALQRTGDCWPALAGAIASVVRHVVLFDDAIRNSFATPAAHGVAFVNVAHGMSEAFFVEDLAHQCGHVLFTAVWEGAEPLLVAPADAYVGELTGQDDHRTLEVALHGMFTQTLMIGSLDRLLCNAEVDRRETTGRLVFALVRLGLDLRALAALPVYSDAGMALIRELLAVYTSVAERYRSSLAAADLTDQPYNFDYDVYRARNPAPGPVTTA